jgi:hypothetical protein
MSIVTRARCPTVVPLSATLPSASGEISWPVRPRWGHYPADGRVRLVVAAAVAMQLPTLPIQTCSVQDRARVRLGDRSLRCSVVLVTCPIFEAAGLALQPRKGVSLRPFGLRFRAPVGLVLGCVTDHHRTEEPEMANNINRVVLSGNITADPELRSLPSGTSVCKVRPLFAPNCCHASCRTAHTV